jgi:hypothetical protein
MFEQCSHGYVALTCPSCKGRPVAAAFAPQAAAVQAPRGNGKHYSGATFEARVELAGMWDDIMARAADQVSRTQLRQGIQDGALVRRPVEVEDA